jgi:hypothetical protein
LTYVSISEAFAEEGESESRIPTEDQSLKQGADVRRAVALVAVAAIAVAVLGWVGANASPTENIGASETSGSR